MRKLTLLFALLCASVMGWAVKYCNTTITAVDGVTTVTLTCVQPTPGTYVMTIVGGANFGGFIGEGNYFELSGVGGNQVKNNTAEANRVCNFDEGSRTLTITMTADRAPKMYTPLYLDISGQKTFTTIQDQVFDWPTECASCTDVTGPTISAVEADNITANSVELAVTASDNDGGTGIARYIVKNGDVQIATSTTSPISVSGLSSGTTYNNIKVIAIDGCDNESSAFSVEAFETLSRASECEGDLGHFGTWDIKRVHYKIEYLPSTNKIRYEVRGYDTQVLDFCQIQTTVGNSPNLTIVDGVAVWKQDAPAAGTEMGILFLFSTDAIGGNEMNAENTSSFVGNNAHLVYYKSRDCEAAVEPATAPTTTPDESTIFNDCQIYSILGSDYYVSAGFNNETNAWGGGTATTENIDGRDVLHIANSNYLERGFNAHDVSGYTHIHFDVWTVEAMNVGMKLMAYDETWREGDRQNFTTNAGSWKSVDLALSGFNHGYLNKIQGIYPLDMQQENIYFTNIYFYKTTEDVACYETLNLAERKPSEAGYEDGNPNETAATANDGLEGDDGHGWVTWNNRPAAEEWWYVDLKNNYEISKIEILWGSDYSTEYILQTRTEAPSNADKADDAAWVTIATVTDAAANATKINTFTTATGRYVRFRSITRSGACIRMREFRVFGNGYAITDVNDPVITTAEVADDSENVNSVKLHLIATDVEDGAVKTFLLNKGDDSWLPIATDASDTYTVSELARGHYSYQVKARDHAGNVSEISTINFDIFNPADNLALNKPVVAGYTPGNPGEVPAKANDGNLGTPWTTYNDRPMDEQWWSVDLGDVYQLSAVDLFWDVRSNHYLIQVAQTEPSDRSDDTQWFTALEVDEVQKTGNAEENKNHYALNVPARYVRFKAVTKDGTFLKLWEFRVFGTGYATEDTNAPEITTAEVAADSENETSVKLHLVATDVENPSVKSFLLNKGDDNWLQISTDANDMYIVTDLARGHYSYQVKAIDNAGRSSDASTISFTIFNPAENLALNKPVVAGYTNPDNAGEVPAKANDGNLGTPWTTYNDRPMDEQWWSVDLGDVYQLSAVDLFWDVRSNHYLIQVAQTEPSDRSDDTQWFTALEVDEVQKTGNAEENKNHYALNVPARYVRFKAITKDGTFLKLWELRVFGSAYATEDTNAPEITSASVTYGEGNAYLTLQATDTEDGAIKTFRVVNTTTGDKAVYTTDGENKIAIAGLDINTPYDFEIQAIDKAANLSVVTPLTVRIPATEGNIALGKPVVAGFETSGPGEAKEKANDGELSTYWATWNTGDVTREWIYVDLESLYDLKKVVVTFDAGLVSGDYILQYRSETPTPEQAADDEAWTDIAEVTTASGSNLRVETEASGVARYVRFRTKTANVRLAELEVYANAAVIELNEAIDNTAVIAANDANVVNAIVTRSFAAGNLYTLVLPFNVDAAQTATKLPGHLTKLQNTIVKENEDLRINFVDVSAIEAGVPYLYEPSAAVANPTFEGVEVSAALNPTVADSHAEYHGIYAPMDGGALHALTNAYVLGPDQYLYAVSNLPANQTMAALRAYFVLNFPSAAPGAPKRLAKVVFNYEEAEILTGIENTIDDEQNTKILRDGQLLIIREGKTYNAQGQLIK